MLGTIQTWTWRYLSSLLLTSTSFPPSTRTHTHLHSLRHTQPSSNDPIYGSLISLKYTTNFAKKELIQKAYIQHMEVLLKSSSDFGWSQAVRETDRKQFNNKPLWKIPMCSLIQDYREPSHNKRKRWQHFTAVSAIRCLDVAWTIMPLRGKPNKPEAISPHWTGTKTEFITISESMLVIPYNFFNLKSIKPTDLTDAHRTEMLFMHKCVS